MIRLGWHRCKHCGLHRCKRRCDDPNRGAIEPGASPGAGARSRSGRSSRRRGPGASVCEIARRANKLWQRLGNAGLGVPGKPHGMLALDYARLLDATLQAEMQATEANTARLLQLV